MYADYYLHADDYSHANATKSSGQYGYKPEAAFIRYLGFKVVCKRMFIDE
jgi:hypothetical protein